MPLLFLSHSAAEVYRPYDGIGQIEDDGSDVDGNYRNLVGKQEKLDLCALTITLNKHEEKNKNLVGGSPLYLELLEVIVKTALKAFLSSIFIAVFKHYNAKRGLCNDFTREIVVVIIKLISGLTAFGFSNLLASLFIVSFKARLKLILLRAIIRRSVELVTKGSLKQFVTIVMTEINRLTLARYSTSIVDRYFEYKETLRKLIVSRAVKKIKMAVAIINFTKKQTTVRKLVLQKMGSKSKKRDKLSMADLGAYFFNLSITVDVAKLDAKVIARSELKKRVEWGAPL